MATATNDQDERLQQEINAENFWKHFQLVLVVGNALALISSWCPQFARFLLKKCQTPTPRRSPTIADLG